MSRSSRAPTSRSRTAAPAGMIGRVARPVRATPCASPPARRADGWRASFGAPRGERRHRHGHARRPTPRHGDATPSGPTTARRDWHADRPLSASAPVASAAAQDPCRPGTTHRPVGFRPPGAPTACARRRPRAQRRTGLDRPRVHPRVASPPQPTAGRRHPTVTDFRWRRGRDTPPELSCLRPS